MRPERLLAHEFRVDGDEVGGGETVQASASSEVVVIRRMRFAYSRTFGGCRAEMSPVQPIRWVSLAAAARLGRGGRPTLTTAASGVLFRHLIRGMSGRRRGYG